ncbi:MAG: hypothetical protein M3461_08350 [Pseudomonadota bacterium]|nr:hypothetical protein [Pseudomonadota bacterium]
MGNRSAGTSEVEHVRLAVAQTPFQDVAVHLNHRWRSREARFNGEGGRVTRWPLTDLTRDSLGEQQIARRVEQQVQRP